MAAIELILFDIGGVLGTNGWDHNERTSVITELGIDRAAFEARHEEAIDTWESGRMTLDEYIDFTVFNEPREFTREQFKELMFAQSAPFPAAIDFAASLARSRRFTMMTLNNEPLELQKYRERLFSLPPIFTAFLSSCYLGVRKPDPCIYERALSISHGDPGANCLHRRPRGEHRADGGARRQHRSRDRSQGDSHRARASRRRVGDVTQLSQSKSRCN